MTSSVARAGVLLAFSFLIIPAVIGTVFAPRRLGVALGIGWGAGIFASFAGFGASVVLDLPTGAAMVAAFAIVLLLGSCLRVVLLGALARGANRRHAAALAADLILLVILAQGAWLVAAPGADQPLLAAAEGVLGFRPERFMTENERRVYAEAAAAELNDRLEVERLGAAEREARWTGQGLSEEELRRVASFQQTYNEMGRGERFVRDHLREVARGRSVGWSAFPPSSCLHPRSVPLWRSRRARACLGDDPISLASRR